MENKTRKILFIDNFDSFTYNLVDDFCKRGVEAIIYRADTDIEVLKKTAADQNPDLLVISPGPGRPENAGVTMQAIDYFKDKLPIFGVCLGHQALCHYFGGTVGHAPSPMHGKGSRVTHNNQGIFQGVDNPLQAGRYHSLCATKMPDCLEVTATCDDIVMGLQHKTLPIFGVQFHPESVLTPTGGKIIQNVLNIAENQKSKNVKG